METVNKKTGEVTVEPVNRLCTYNKAGHELLDPKPAALHVTFKRPIPLGERIRQLVQNELLARELGAAGMESFAEADDFDTGEVDQTAPYEETFDPDHSVCREQEIRAGYVEEVPLSKKERAKKLLTDYKNNAKIPPTVKDTKEVKNEKTDEETSQR